MDIPKDIHGKILDTDVDIDGKFHINGKPAKRRGVGRGCPPSPSGSGLGRGGAMLFCDLEMAYFGKFWGPKFKVFFIVSSLSGVRVDSATNIGFSSKTMSEIHH